MSRTIVFVAYFEQDNLGVGYIASKLMQEGFHVHFVDFRDDKENVARQILDADPIAVGFSIIFQYHIHSFKELIDYLRASGVHCHFSAGGHFPSLRTSEILHYIPALDSICLQEAEYTFLELVGALHGGSSWTHIDGLAYQTNGGMVTNPSRPLEQDLDRLPPPVRLPSKFGILGQQVAVLLAGRGCRYNCSFCSIRQFYSGAPGPLKRLRKPESVVEEMQLLNTDYGSTIFLFQDDDFPVAGRSGKRWARQFCRHLAESGLAKKIMWKISCRSDEIDRELFAEMKEHGLYLVYLGIESGNQSGLQTLNKRLTVDDSLYAVELLRDLGIIMEYGFMLFDPSSTFETVRDNLYFLNRICSQGSAPIGFCKMLPYAGTPIEKALAKEGRLSGRLGLEDYNFLSPAMDDYFLFMAECFSAWMSDMLGVHTALRQARTFLAVLLRFYRQEQNVSKLQARLLKLTHQSNQCFLTIAEELANRFENEHPPLDDRDLEQTRLAIARKQTWYSEAIQTFMVQVDECAAGSLEKSMLA